jgi:hypothetical protein
MIKKPRGILKIGLLKGLLGGELVFSFGSFR